MLIPFGHHHGGFGGAHRGAVAVGMVKVLIVFAAFVLAVVARYAAAMWVEQRYDDPSKANMAGWVAFFAVLIVIGVGGVKLV